MVVESFCWGCRIGFYGGCRSAIGWLGRRERSVFQHFFRASGRYVREFSLGVPPWFFAVFWLVYMVVAVAQSAGLDVEKGAFFNISLGRQYVTLGTFRCECRLGFLLFFGLCIWWLL